MPGVEPADDQHRARHTGSSLVPTALLPGILGTIGLIGLILGHPTLGALAVVGGTILLGDRLLRRAGHRPRHPSPTAELNRRLRSLRHTDGYWTISADEASVVDCSISPRADGRATVHIEIRTVAPSISGFDGNGTYQLEAPDLSISCALTSDDPQQTCSTFLDHHGPIRVEATGTIIHDGTSLVTGPTGGRLIDVTKTIE